MSCLNTRTNYDLTPLILAAYNNKPLCLEALLEYDVTIDEEEGRTALDGATMYNSQECVQLLTEYINTH